MKRLTETKVNKRNVGQCPQGREYIEKCKTGIRGFDEITQGGLPRSRTTLVCGDAGAGKTLLAMEFLMHGARDFEEPALLISFDEQPEELIKDVQSVGFDVPALVERGSFFIDFVSMGDDEFVESGKYDLAGLFIRLDAAIEATGAMRIVLDSLDSLFARFANTTVLREEIQRLFKWLKSRGLTTVVTCERGDGKLTRNGIEEYVSDCVIVLSRKINEYVSTRNLRLLKYRGSAHGTNEYPFLIDDNGILIVPITSITLQHSTTEERISTGIPDLDRMLGGKGLYRGSTVMVTGVAGTGKTSIASQFIDAACTRGEPTLYYAFEESPAQVIRNMRSIGIDLGRWVRKGLLQFRSTRPFFQGLDAHLAEISQTISEFQPANVVLDPVSDFTAVGAPYEIKAMLNKLVNFMMTREVTCLFTSLIPGHLPQEQTGSEISSLADTWLLLKNTEYAGERNRLLYVMKSRGMAHSNQVREFQLTEKGVRLVDISIGPDGILTGSARIAYEQAKRNAARERQDKSESAQHIFEMRQKAFDAKIALLKAEFDAETMQITTEAEATERERQMAVDAQKTEMDMRQGIKGKAVRRQIKKGRSS